MVVSRSSCEQSEALGALRRAGRAGMAMKEDVPPQRCCGSCRPSAHVAVAAEPGHAPADARHLARRLPAGMPPTHTGSPRLARLLRHPIAHLSIKGLPALLPAAAPPNPIGAAGRRGSLLPFG